MHGDDKAGEPPNYCGQMSLKLELALKMNLLLFCKMPSPKGDEHCEEIKSMNLPEFVISLKKKGPTTSSWDVSSEE